MASKTYGTILQSQPKVKFWLYIYNRLLKTLTKYVFFSFFYFFFINIKFENYGNY